MLHKKRILGVIATLTLFLTFVVPATMAQSDNFDLTVEHRINGKSAGAILADDPKAFPKELPVDVYVNGDLVIDNFTFGQKVNTSLPADTYSVEVFLDIDDQDNPVGKPIMSLGSTPIPGGVKVFITARLIDETPQLVVKVK